MSSNPIDRRRIDPRADPHATQKISREMLDDVLRRTKSGTRPATRSHHDAERSADDEDSFLGPRDSAPEITIVKIESVAMSVFDPAAPPPPTLEPHLAPRPSPVLLSRRLYVTPRLAFLAGLAVVAFIGIAAVVGFFAGRFTLH